MRLFSLLLVLLPFSIYANHQLVGLWEGFDLQGGSFNSHILELDDNGNGYYVFSLSGSLDESFVMPIDTDNFIYSDGFYKHTSRLLDGKSFTVLFAEDLKTTLSVITIARGPNNKVLLSFSWDLSKVQDNLQNERLYKFAREIVNLKSGIKQQ